MCRIVLAFWLTVVLLGCGGSPASQTPPASAGSPAPSASTPLVERIGDTGFIQLYADSFQQLDDRQKALAYWLSQASIAIDPIIYDQLSRFGLRQKRVLEQIAAHSASMSPDTMKKLRSYSLLFWAN